MERVSQIIEKANKCTSINQLEWCYDELEIMSRSEPRHSIVYAQNKLKEKEEELINIENKSNNILNG